MPQTSPTRTKGTTHSPHRRPYRVAVRGPGEVGDLTFGVACARRDARVRLS
ncbi:UNVERIFIED_ORG: hypothetical protein L601_001400000180 [Gordonia westfalica J30]